MLADRILFIDAEAIVLDKPAGLPVDRPRDGSDSLEDALESLRFGFQREPHAVHRLDRDTSGCLLLARNPKAHKRFAAAFEEGKVAKTYIAIIDGIPSGESGVIDMPLSKRSTKADGWRMVPDPKGKPAVTRWTLMRLIGGRSLVSLSPDTGRTHQLRVHLASGLGLPIVGDPVYGRGNGRMMLHAWFLTVPRDPKPAIVARADWPEAFIGAGFSPPQMIGNVSA